MSKFAIKPRINKFVVHHFFFQLLLEEDNECFQ